MFWRPQALGGPCLMRAGPVAASLLAVLLIAPSLSLAGSAGSPLGSLARVEGRPDLGLHEDGLHAILTFATFDRMPSDARLVAQGVVVAHRFHAIPAIEVVGTAHALDRLRSLPGLEALQHDRALRWAMDTATVATRAADVWGDTWHPGYVNPPTRPKIEIDLDHDGDKEIIDGTGVVAGVVDSGANGLHPDLWYGLPGGGLPIGGDGLPIGGDGLPLPAAALPPQKLLACVNILPGLGQPIDQPYCDETVGHGTHVAGILAGNAWAYQQGLAPLTAESPNGVAPGAQLVVAGLGAGLSLIAFDLALEWMHDNAATYGIRVINNSYGDPQTCSDAMEPDAASKALIDAIVDDGIVMVYAAGNYDTAGAATFTSPTASYPRPGVISVANYDDLNSGTRAGTIASGSSDGCPGRIWTFPDVSAPGTDILSTAAYTGTLNHLETVLGLVGSSAAPAPPFYSPMSGTSMAAPHVAGIVALMLQANPDLTPAQVERILIETATPWQDSVNEGGSPGTAMWGSNAAAGAFTDLDDCAIKPSNFATFTNADDLDESLYLCRDIKRGRGLVDAYAAVARAAGESPPPPPGDGDPAIHITAPAASANLPPGTVAVTGDVDRDASGTPNNQAPTATLSANPVSGPAPLGVTFTLGASDPDGTIASWSLDFGDGLPATGTGNPPATQAHNYGAAGTYNAELTVTDDDGGQDTAPATIVVSPGGSGPACGAADLFDDDNDNDDVSGVDGVAELTCTGISFDGETFTFTANVDDKHTGGLAPRDQMFYDFYFTPEFGILSAGVEQLIEVTWTEATDTLEAFWDLGGSLPLGLTGPTFTADPTRTVEVAWEADTLTVTFPASYFESFVSGDELSNVRVHANHCEGTTCTITDDDFSPAAPGGTYTLQDDGGSPLPVAIPGLGGLPALPLSTSSLNAGPQATDPVGDAACTGGDLLLDGDGLGDIAGMVTCLAGQAFLDITDVEVHTETPTAFLITLHVDDMSTLPPSLSSDQVPVVVAFNYGTEFCTNSNAQTYTGGNYAGLTGVVCYRLSATSGLLGDSFSGGVIQADGSGSCGLSGIIDAAGSAFDLGASTVTWKVLKSGLTVNGIGAGVDACTTSPPTTSGAAAANGDVLSRLAGQTGTQAGAVITFTFSQLGDTTDGSQADDYTFGGVAPPPTLTVDAGGPYGGLVAQPINIVATAAGGTAPVACAWTGTGASFGNANACSTTVSFAGSGAHTIHVQATDGGAPPQTAGDDATVTTSSAGIERVEIFLDTNPTVQATLPVTTSSLDPTAIWSANLQVTAPGAHLLTAVWIDTDGSTLASTARSFSIQSGGGDPDPDPGEDDPTPPPVNQRPAATLIGGPRSGCTPLQVTFQTTASDPDGPLAHWAFDADGDGDRDMSGTGAPPAAFTHTYPATASGTRNAMLMVFDARGDAARPTLSIDLGAPCPPPPTTSTSSSSSASTTSTSATSTTTSSTTTSTAPVVVPVTPYTPTVERLHGDSSKVGVKVAAADGDEGGARVTWTLPAINYTVTGVQVWRVEEGAAQLVVELSSASDAFKGKAYTDAVGDEDTTYVVTMFAAGDVGRYQGSEAPAVTPLTDTNRKAKDSPEPGLVLAALALVGLALLRRRRVA